MKPVVTFINTKADVSVVVAGHEIYTEIVLRASPAD
jgi:hypothetical protein